MISSASFVQALESWSGVNNLRWDWLNKQSLLRRLVCGPVARPSRVCDEDLLRAADPIWLTGRSGLVDVTPY